MSASNLKILNENKTLRDEVEVLGKSGSSPNVRGKSPNDVRTENKGQVMTELDKLRREN